MPNSPRDGITMLNLHSHDRNLLNNMAKASGETRPQFISRLLQREARERGLSPAAVPSYPNANKPKDRRR